MSRTKELAKYGVIQSDLETGLREHTPPGTLGYLAVTVAPLGWLKANGAAVSVTTYADLADAIYVGDVLNATADWGYRCTDNLDPSNTRSTTGGYIVIPDGRGEFPRGFDDGRGVDAGRSFGTAQLDQMQRILGSIRIENRSTGSSIIYAGNADAMSSSTSGSSASSVQNSSTNASRTLISFNSASSPSARVSSTNDGETRSRNIAMLACIKY